MTVSRPSVSIILPAFNVEAYLSDAVESVLRQTLTSWELVIVDDGSVDGTGPLADALSRRDERITVIHQDNGGVSRARNAGFCLSDRSSQMVVFLDADDVWEHDALERLSDGFARHPDAVAVYGLPRMFEADPEVALSPARIEDAEGRKRHAVRGRRRVSVPIDAPASFEVMCLWSCIVTGGQILIRRSAIPGPAPFVPDILSQDWLFWMLLSRRGDIVPIDHFVIRKRYRQDSLMRSANFGKAEMIVRRHLIDLPEMTSNDVRIAKIGHRWAVVERLSWAWSSLRRGDLVGSAKQVRQSFLAGRAYLQMRHEYDARHQRLRAAEGVTP